MLITNTFNNGAGSERHLPKKRCREHHWTVCKKVLKSDLFARSPKPHPMWHPKHGLTMAIIEKEAIVVHIFPIFALYKKAQKEVMS